MLDVIHLFIKLCQGKDVYICDLVVVGKVFQGYIYAIFMDEAKSFEFSEFRGFNDFILGVSDFAPLEWLCTLNTCN